MIAEILVTAIFLYLILFYIYFTWSMKYFERLGVPHEKPHFIFGNIKDVVSKKMHISVLMKKYYDKFKDAAYVGYYKFNIPYFLIRDPELIKDILIKDFTSFAHNHVTIETKNDPVFKLNPFTQDFEDWRVTRTHMSPCFTANKVKMIFRNDIEETSDNMVKYLDELNTEKKNELFDVFDLVSRYTTDVLTAFVFGVKCNSFQDPNSVYRSTTKKMDLISFWSKTSAKMFIVPFLRKIVKLRYNKQSVSDEILQFTKDTISYRTQNSIVRNDIYQQMIALRQKVGNKVFSDEFIAAQAFGVLFDGFVGSSRILAHFLYEIGQNAEIQNRLRQEISEIFEANDDQELLYDKIMKAKYLDMVISEVLRLHPTILSLERTCTKPYTLPPPTFNSKPVKVTPGDVMCVPVYGIHMDPNFYPDPEKFNPEHFTNEAIASRPKCSYMPFGEGPRICYGFRLGQAIVKIALAKLILRFQVRTSAKCLKSGYTIDPESYLKTPIEKLWVNIYKI